MRKLLRVDGTDYEYEEFVLDDGTAGAAVFVRDQTGGSVKLGYVDRIDGQTYPSLHAGDGRTLLARFAHAHWTPKANE